MARSPAAGRRTYSQAPIDNRSASVAEIARKAAITDALSKSQAMIEFDMNGTILNANDNFLRVMGYTLPEIQGRHHRMFVDDVTRNSEQYREFWVDLNHGQFSAARYKRIGKGGKEVWLQATYNPVLDENGRPVKVVKFAADVTEAAVQLAEKVGITDALGKSQAMIEFDMNGIILMANDNFLRVMGYTLPEIQGRHHGMFVDEGTRNSDEYREFWAKLNRGLFNAAQYKRIGKGGREIWLQATYNPVLDNNGRPIKVVKFAADVTAMAIEQNRAQEREQRMQLEQAAVKRALEGNVNALLQVVTAAANGDLTVDSDVRGDDDMGRLAGGIRKMLGDLRNVIAEVVESADQQNQGARVFAESSTNLSDGAQTQSASVEMMTASVDQLVSSIQIISQNAAESKAQADETVGLAKAGGDTVVEAVKSMRLIQKSSEQVNEIIQVISEIASQTNLLALNAAIEAARAGEHGLGFAVVADEVRKLAERSSGATKEITELIKASSRRVVEGADLSEKVGQSLNAIVEAIEKTASGIAKIAASTETQATSATEVKTAISSVSETTESAAAAAEEMAASAEQLGAQAQSLRKLVAKFKV